MTVILVSIAWAILGSLIIILLAKELIPLGHLTFSIKNVLLIVGSVLAVTGGVLSSLSNRIGPYMLLGSFIALTLNAQWGGINLSVSEVIKFITLGFSVLFIWNVNATTKHKA